MSMITPQLFAAAALSLAAVSVQAQSATATAPVQASAEQSVIYSANFVEQDGGFTPDNPAIWKKNATRGWQAFGHLGTGNVAIDANLTSPEIDLTGYTDPKLSLTQIASMAKNDTPSDVLHVEILEGGKVTEINDDLNWPDGSNYDPVTTTGVSLATWAGKKIRVQFHYTSTTVEALIWAISSLTIEGTPTGTGINQLTTTGKFDPAKPYAVYAIDGTRLAGLNVSGLKIVKQNGHAWKLAK